MKNLPIYLATYLLIGIHPLQAHEDPWKAEEYYQNSSSQKDAANDLMKYVPINADSKILDVGSGDGKITAEIASRVSHGYVIGVDISPSMLNFAQTNFPENLHNNLTFSLKNAEALDYEDEFDIVFSFTALQWVQDHAAFLQGAHHALKANGTLAITMPMGLPAALEQAVNEVIALPQWSPYFHDFSTGWNFVETDQYAHLLKSNRFSTVRLAVVPQKDIFPSKEAFQKFAGQWFPYLRPLPENLKPSFFNQVIDRFLELEPLSPHGEVYFKIRRLEVVAKSLK